MDETFERPFTFTPDQIAEAFIAARVSGSYDLIQEEALQLELAYLACKALGIGDIVTTTTDYFDCVIGIEGTKIDDVYRRRHEYLSATEEQRVEQLVLNSFEWSFQAIQTE